MEINTEYSMKGLMLKLKLQYFIHLIRIADWLEKYHDAAKDWRQQEKGALEDEMVGWYHQLSWHEFEQILRVMKEREAWHAAVHGSQRVRHDWVTEQQQIYIW